MAVGHTKGKVGIGEEVGVGVLLHHAADIGAHETVDFTLVNIVGYLHVGRICVGVCNVEKVDGGVAIADDFLPVLGFVFLEEFVVLCLVVEHRLVVDVFEQFLDTCFVFAFFIQIGGIACAPHVEESLDKDGTVDGRMEFEVGEIGLVGGEEFVAFHTCQTVVVGGLPCHAIKFVGAVHEVGGHDSFVEVDPLQFDGTNLLVGAAEVAENVLVFGTLVGPGLEDGFLFFFLFDTVETLNAEGFALPFLPTVGDRGHFGSIFETLGGRLVHSVVVVLEANVAKGDADGVLLNGLEFNLMMCNVALGGAGIAEDKSKVAFVNTLERDV